MARTTYTGGEADILIIGAGVAGCTAAIALAGSHRVVLVDKLAEPAERIGECLPPAGRRILRRLNLLEEFEKDAAGEVRALKSMGMRSYWGTGSAQITDHLRNPDGHGWHLDRRAFERSLRETALQRGVQGCWPAKLQSTRYENGRWHVTAADDQAPSGNAVYHFETKFVIDASGRSSHFARKKGLARNHFDKLVACWAVLPDREQNKMGTISACEKGWWYTAALPGRKRVLALQTDADLLDRAAVKSADGFTGLARTDPHVAAILERSGGEIDYRGTVAANSTCLARVAGRQWAALGDAAMSFDPLSSQGMFNAMAGAMQLADLVRETGCIDNPAAENTERFYTTYTGQMAQIWQHYLYHKHVFYGRERRWKEAEFWKRRQ